MASSILSKLFWTFALLCLFLLVNFSEPDQITSNDESHETQTRKAKSEMASMQAFPRFLSAYQNIKKLEQSKLSIEVIEQALEIAAEDGFDNPVILRQLHLMKADIHEEKWHTHFAIESLLAAQKLKFDRQTDRKIKQLRKYIARVEQERNLNQEYVATRHSGPAKTLTGKVLVAYIFIDDGVKTRWSDKSLRRSQQTLRRVQNWQIAQSKRYAVKNIEFINKTYMVQRNPKLKALSSLSDKTSDEYVEKLVKTAMEHLGAKDVEDFIGRQMDLVGADQGAIIFHSNFNRRSFAHRCGYTHRVTYYKNGVEQVEMISRCHDEFVMLMEQVKRNRWDKLHYAQAHEILHLFGADDLYNIENASNFALVDIMNFQSKNIGDSEISPVTAYAIGWRDKKPKTPFKILDK